MKGGKIRRTRGKSQQNSRTDDKSPSESEDTSDTASNHTEHEAMETIQANIIAEIRAVRSDMKKEFTDTMALLKGELADFRGEINQKLSAIFTDLKGNLRMRVVDFQYGTAGSSSISLKLPDGRTYPPPSKKQLSVLKSCFYSMKGGKDKKDERKVAAKFGVKVKTLATPLAITSSTKLRRLFKLTSLLRYKRFART